MDAWIWNLNNDIRLIHMWVWTFKTSWCSNPDYIICTRALCSYWDEWQNSKPFGLTRLSKRHEGSCVFNSLYKPCDTASHSSGTGIENAHNLHNPQTSGNRNESKNVRGKLSMPPFFLHHSLWKATVTLFFSKRRRSRCQKPFLQYFSERLKYKLTF